MFRTITVLAPDDVARFGEPLRCGIPCDKGQLGAIDDLLLCDAEGNRLEHQSTALNRWSDGTIRWLLIDWQGDVNHQAVFALSRAASAHRPQQTPHLCQPVDHGWQVNTGVISCRLDTRNPFALQRTSDTKSCGVKVNFIATDGDGRRLDFAVDRIDCLNDGPVQATLQLTGRLNSTVGRLALDVVVRLHFFANRGAVRLDMTLCNPRSAIHPGGNWDLGDPRSVLLSQASIVLEPDQQAERLLISPAPDVESASAIGSISLDQDSSGGNNWQSTAHLNRYRRVPHRFQGYQLAVDGQIAAGRRAQPIAWLERSGECLLAATSEYFWQEFPKSVELSPDRLMWHFFPPHSVDGHELQPGEQKTHTVWFSLGPDPITPLPLHWARRPSLARVDSAAYCGAGVVPPMLAEADDPRADYARLVRRAIEGSETFEHKREVIDEYGWRHFGDIYGDHEAAFHHGAQPLVSHYNNQYDAVAGFALQFFRTGDPRWWQQMVELARHVVDIDLYHTTRDKPAYNHGLFWHTYHYIDADTAHHRTYPKAAGVCGGGPSAEHAYASGLMLHYFLTGDHDSRQAVLEMAGWIMAMDDGRRTPFRWLAGGPTGLASASGNPNYHGPGRGPANAVRVLLDGWQLSGNEAWFDKAEELIRRVVHPQQDIDALNLLDAERRWFYTMFLQTLGHYLDVKIERGQLDFMYAYGRAVLLHYARWMADHEYPYLEQPAKLEYPTETWPAQDMRKSEVFKYAALHAEGPERARFLERADFFFRYVVDTLGQMPTSTFCRPMVLLLSYGLRQGYFDLHPESAAPPPDVPATAWPPPCRFEAQKTRARCRFVALVGVGAGTLLTLAASMALSWLGR